MVALFHLYLLHVLIGSMLLSGTIRLAVILYGHLALLSLNLLNTTTSEHQVHEAALLDFFHINTGAISPLQELAARIFVEWVGAVHLQDDGLRED